MKKSFLAASLLALLISSTGCKKSWFDINDNPNNPTDESVTPNLLLPSVLTRSSAQMAISYASTARWMGYWSRSGTYGPNAEEESYNISTTFEQGEWSTWFDIMNDNNVMGKKAAETNQPFYQGVSSFMKTIGFMYLVDQYNNVPYSKAFDLNNNILPTYDKGQDIYADLYIQLDSAIAQFNRAQSNDEIEEFDIMFHGNLTSWKRLVNTQRLRLTLRQSGVSGFNASAQIAKITADGTIGAGQTAYVQPGYVQDQNKQNPYWNAFEALYTGDVADNFNRANNYILGKYQNSGDPRYTRVFDPVASACSGCNPAIAAGQYYGYNYGEVNNDPDQPKAANSSGVGGPALAQSASQPQWFFTSVEAMFLRAEAIQRGWITGTAQTAYNAAITESFTWLGLSSGQATTYIGGAFPIVQWPATAAAQLNIILTQKYMAMIGINNFEPWVDYRRTGVPTDLPLSLSPSRNGRIIPLRLLYPQAEYNFNAANVAAEGTINPQTSKIFWDN